MPDTRRSSRVLPPEVLASLRAAFAGEVAERLPRLLLLLDTPPGPDALRDAHTLASGSVVVGELAASDCARELEAELTRERPDPARTAGLVRALEGHLRGWLPV